MDCIYETLSNKMPNMTVEKIFGCNGIANIHISFKYAGEWFDIIDGRGIGNPIEVMETLNIPFSIYSIDDFWKCNSKDDFLIFASKDLISKYKDINISYKQLLFFYSCFYIDRQSDSEIILKIVHDDTEYVISKSDLKKILSFSTFPFEKSVYIVKIENTTYDLDPHYARKTLLNKVNIFLGNNIEKEELRIKIAGSNMYDEFANIIKKSCYKWDRVSMMKQHFLIASINAGSDGLYRREFAKSLGKVLGVEDKETCGYFIKSANAWREIGRELSYFQKNNIPISDECKTYILSIIEEIKELELEAMKKVKNYLTGDYKR